MSVQYGQLCSLIVSEHFGEVVQSVAQDLFQVGCKTLPQIVSSTGLRRAQVIESLRVLIRHGLVIFRRSENSPDIPEYILRSEKVLLFLRYTRYMLLVKNLFGDEAELLVEELLKYGVDRASSIIVKATLRLKENKKDEESVTVATVRDKLVHLMNKQFIMRCPLPSVEDSKVPELTVKEQTLYLPPRLNLKELINLEKELPSECGEDDVLLRVNFDRFHQEFRDEIMISAIRRRIDDHAGELMRILLEQMYVRTGAWIPTSNPIPIAEIRDAVRKLKSNPHLLQYLEQYLRVMEEDSSRFVMRVGENAGGQYVVHIKEAFIQLCWASVESIVEERFGSKAARVFRLIKAKKFIEQEQIEQLALIPAKEAKSITYNLLGEGFIQFQELRKSLGAGGPNKTFFLFHVDIDQIARKVLEMCYKALYNSITRRQHEQNEHERLIEKHQRVTSVAANLREQGAPPESITEIEELLTPLENETVKNVQIMITRLGEAELQLDDNMFLMQLYVMYSHCK